MDREPGDGARSGDVLRADPGRVRARPGQGLVGVGMSKRMRDEITVGRLVNRYDALEVMRRQTVALRDYLRFAKDGIVPDGKTKGEVAVELYLANDKAIKCLFDVLGIDPKELKA